jgi:GT2 family glycosyltransferase
MIDVSVIVVTFNSSRCIANCLNSISSQKGVSFETIVVDNASSDETTKRLEESACLLIKNKENIGFGRACNIGFSESKGRYVYFLNPDAELIGENCLDKMCRRMDENPVWGIAGTRVYSSDGSLESLPAKAYPGDAYVSRDFSKLPGSIAWLIGASIIIRRELFASLNGFDADYFLYSEETDICLRARQLGFEIACIEEVSIRHVGGDSEAESDPHDVACRKARGLLLFKEKHYSHSDCVSSAKRDIRRAFSKMILNRIIAMLRPKHSAEWKKYRTYQGVWETTSLWLEKTKEKK